MNNESDEFPRNPQAGEPASEAAERDESDAPEEPTFDEAQRTEESGRAADSGSADAPRDQEPKP